ncbi:serine hydrolase [Lactobacillus sp. CBA3605]|uniref:serine hydrolase domain-containing protein n=1 Tax=Lactobacillus sp. CBA3605 TaxID=2099788 RepID=UPI001F2BFFA4|nr:serine hydrolase domain-containing protein [Lactobacillus sp. CBA3605]
MKRWRLTMEIVVGSVVVFGLMGLAFHGIRTTQVNSVTTPKPVVKKTAMADMASTRQLTQAQAMTQITALVKRRRIMGTLLVTNNGPTGVQIKSFGAANVAPLEPNTANEAYPLASLQKAVTGAMIQQLINEKRLSMTTPLSMYLPQVPYANQITIRELLDHTSGIRMKETTPPKLLPTEPAQLNYTLTHLKSTNHHTYAYSNANFTLLAGVIRQVTGRSYQANLQAKVLKPLGMRHTYAYNEVPANVTNPVGYRLTNLGLQRVFLSKPLQSSELGCGSLYASVGDYYRFMQALLSGRLVGQTGLNMLTANKQLTYAAGVYYLGQDRVRIGGSDNGFHTYYMGTTNGQVGVVLFDNQGNFKRDNAVGYEIQAILNRAERFKH